MERFCTYQEAFTTLNKKRTIECGYVINHYGEHGEWIELETA